jgi:hypothetical protein
VRVYGLYPTPNLIVRTLCFIVHHLTIFARRYRSSSRHPTIIVHPFVFSSSFLLSLFSFHHHLTIFVIDHPLAIPPLSFIPSPSRHHLAISSSSRHPTIIVHPLAMSSSPRHLVIISPCLHVVIVHPLIFSFYFAIVHITSSSSFAFVLYSVTIIVCDMTGTVLMYSVDGDSLRRC